MGQITRMWLDPSLPHGTAERAAADDLCHGLAGMALITYHDRTRHTGCAYRKAGFRKDGVTNPGALGWGSREGRTSAVMAPTPKRRWRVDLTP